ncbi:rhamnogalacturonate lyase [Trifolium repens]|nr:rhamnogalacturonate lyase [Trifolium repens]
MHCNLHSKYRKNINLISLFHPWFYQNIVDHYQDLYCLKMKMGRCMFKRFQLFLWFRMALQLCFMFGAYSEHISFRRGLSNAQSPVTLLNNPNQNQNSPQVVISNGIFTLTLANPGGYVTAISYSGIDNVLEGGNEDIDRGYFDVVFGKTFQRVHGTSFTIITRNDNIVEVSFLRTWQPSMDSSSVPINIDQRYIVRRGDSGFYTYVIFERPKGFPAISVDQIRTVFKPKENLFNYMAVSDTIQRRMPTMRDRETGQPLAFPEAVLLTNPSDPQFKGQVDDKYQYSSENQYIQVNGWITADSEKPVGFWIITPSNEFRNGGPVKQDLTSHVGPICLSMFVSTHYAGKTVTIEFKEGEAYKKVFGPIFIYLNSAPSKDKFKSLWSDAKQKLSNEIKSWPYNFIQSKDFIPPNQRGTLSGRLQVQDGGDKPLNANNAYIGLALPGPAGSWQRESKGYQFWIRSDPNGNFVIKNIVPGTYNLFAWVPGYIGDYIYKDLITIKPGSTISLNSLVYNPPRNGPTLWEIGIPDRSAGEFYVPNPYANLMNKLYMNDNKYRYRQYGIWSRYTDLYPKSDLVFTVGVSKWQKDWFFAHVPRIIGNKTFQATTWSVIFKLENVLTGNYTLQLALASASNAEVQVWFNKMSASHPYFTTKRIGDDNAVPRHGIHGLYWLFTIEVPSIHLVKGINTVYLRQPRFQSFFQAVLYDYIRLESPPTTK